MRRPEIHYVSLWLAAAILVVFALQYLLPYRWAWSVGAVEWQFFGSMLAHGGVGHLLGNLFALGLFGLILEGTVGSRRTVTVLIAAGILGNLAGIGSYDSVIGASGAIYGLIGAMTVLRPRMVIWFEFLPMPMIVAGAAYALVDIVGAIGGGTGTGHLAHLAGLVAGGLLAVLWRKDVPPERPRRDRKQKLSREERRRIDAGLDDYERRYIG